MSASKEFKEYLKWLVKNHENKVKRSWSDPVGFLLMYSGALLNWVGEYVSDKSLTWTKKRLKIDDLTLTGTGPEWNEIIIKQAERQPAKLRVLLKDPKVKKIFESALFSPEPILIRVEDTKEGKKLKILDGMNRTISSIRDGREEIDAWVCERTSKPQPEIEPHVIYDFLRAYDQGRGNKNDLISALRFLIETYSNSKSLLESRFSSLWINNEEINKLVNDLLKEDN